MSLHLSAGGQLELTHSKQPSIHSNTNSLIESMRTSPRGRSPFTSPHRHCQWRLFHRLVVLSGFLLLAHHAALPFPATNAGRPAARRQSTGILATRKEDWTRRHRASSDNASSRHVAALPAAANTLVPAASVIRLEGGDRDASDSLRSVAATATAAATASDPASHTHGHGPSPSHRRRHSDWRWQSPSARTPGGATAMAAPQEAPLTGASTLPLTAPHTATATPTATSTATPTATPTGTAAPIGNQSVALAPFVDALPIPAVLDVRRARSNGSAAGKPDLVMGAFRTTWVRRAPPPSLPAALPPHPACLTACLSRTASLIACLPDLPVQREVPPCCGPTRLTGPLASKSPCTA